MTNSRTRLFKSCAVGLCFVSWSVVLWGESLTPSPLEKENAADRDKSSDTNPMDVEGLDAKLADVLTKYYKRTFGGPDNWKQIQSVRFDGILHLTDGSVRFTAFKKKPNYSKVVIHLGESELFRYREPI